MKVKSLEAIRSAFRAELAELKTIPKLPEEGRWEYHRRPEGGWQGDLRSKPSFFDLHRHKIIDTLAAEVEKTLQDEYPEYLRAVGTPMVRGALQPALMLNQLAHEAYKRFDTFALTGEQIDAILVDVVRFFDRKTILLRIYAPVLNLRGARDTPPIAFPDQVILRPMTDEECTRFYGGNPIFQFRRIPIGFPDFVFIKEIEVPKITGSFETHDTNPLKPIWENLDLCLLALATFKDSGAIGYDGAYITSAEFSLGIVSGDHHLFGNESLPLGSYEITSNEAPEIETHASFFSCLHPALEMASQRLVDSGRRTKARDTVVDVVIGLETILLSNIDERTELRFRFSLNYAALFAKKEREAAFFTARDLYDLRSKIAHGASPGEKNRINGKDLTIAEAATLARSMLRKTIVMFISNARNPDFMAERYWISKELGL
ncbi:MAG: hypothetical protein ACRD4S_13435 [Candidatus Acidiferrales bacterium]